jgi:hypothetical protein
LIIGLYQSSDTLSKRFNTLEEISYAVFKTSLLRHVTSYKIILRFSLNTEDTVELPEIRRNNSKRAVMIGTVHTIVMTMTSVDGKHMWTHGRNKKFVQNSGQKHVCKNQ